MALFSVFCFPICAFAHPGRTDSDGGHNDRSTGEYHYHHGYPAHDHYDMDGDGIIDCPYDFDDKTGENSGSSSSGSGYSYSYSPSEETIRRPRVTAPAPTEPKKEEVTGNMNAIYTAIVMFVVGAIALAIQARSHRDKKDRLEMLNQEKSAQIQKLNQALAKANTIHESDEKSISKLKGEISRLNGESLVCEELSNALEYEYNLWRKINGKLCEKLSKEIASHESDGRTISELKEKVSSLAEADHNCKVYEERYNSLLETIIRKNKEIPSNAYSIQKPISKEMLDQLDLKIEIPDNVLFSKSELPILFVPDRNFPYGGYTVFSNDNSDVYHVNEYCSVYRLAPEHVFKMLEAGKRPCKKCGYSSSVPSAIPQWYLDLKKIRKGNEGN